MRRAIFLLMLAGFLVLASCGRKEDVPEPGVPPTPAGPKITELELPLTNHTVGLTISSLPEGLVASHSADDGIMLAVRNDVRTLVFFDSLPDATMLTPEDYFEDARRRSASFSGGAQFSTGIVETTPFGPATWSASRFTLDGRDREQLELRTLHPSGRGVLQVRLLYMQGSANLADRVDQVRELLNRVEASG
jgi:hypothetical protein